MKKIISILSLLTVSALFAQEKNIIDAKDLLFAATANAQQIEQKGDFSALPKDLQVQRMFGELFRKATRLPYNLGSILREPEKYNVNFTNYSVYGLTKDSMFTLVFVVDVEDYDLFATALFNSGYTNFQEKDGIVELQENQIFTDKKKLVLIHTTRDIYKGKNKTLYVNNKEEALRKHSFYGTEAEYQTHLLIPIEERNYGNYGDFYHEDVAYDEVTATDSVSTEVVEEYAEYEDDYGDATEVAEETYEENRERYYSIDYYAKHQIIDNFFTAIPFFKATNISGKSASIKKYNKEVSDIKLWFNGDAGLDFYNDFILHEMRFFTRSFGLSANNPDSKNELITGLKD